MDLSIIIVNKDSSSILKKCIESVFIELENSNIKYEIFLVDNGSTDNSIDVIGQSHKSIINILKNKVNLGFAKACNQALTRCAGVLVLFLNPDVYIKQGAIKEIVKFLDNNSDIGVIGCKLLNEDSTWQRSYGRYPTFMREVAETLIPRYILKKVAISTVHGYKEYKKITEVDWLSGAFLMSRKKILKSISGFDESFFIYYEDIDLCKRIKGGGWKICYYPYKEVIHLKHRINNKLDNILIDNGNSPYIYFKKHYGQKTILPLRFLFIIKLFIRVVLYFFGSFFLKKKNFKRKANLNWNTLKYNLKYFN